ncbi:D-alanine--D-alanine ligase family protein [Propionicicella superfundia]|uniref:D-alanine--D-alanine ligase family protein n=1 Tax=Propionicicella superfundia TaxID=348582 RepID=UPI000425DF14|nr:D-alanine--D-alanine ligase [Propionicicella superfundia]
MSAAASEFDGTIVVLAGGLSHERDVSLRSGRRVAQALRDLGCSVLESDVTPELFWMLQTASDPVVFPVVHGGVGEDGSLRQVLELLDVPTVGASATAARLAFDKSICTPVVATAGVRVPRQAALPQEMFQELGAQPLIARLAEEFGFPLVVKPARGGSALGYSKVTQASELPAAIVGAFSYSPVVVFEEFIDGVEVAVGVIDRGSGPEALPAVEIRPRSGAYDYTARYTAGETRFIVPAEIDADVAAECAEMAVSAHVRLNLAELSRADIIVGPDGPVFIETNVAPGLTETSTVPLGIEAAGLGLASLCLDLVRVARQRHLSRHAG